MEHVRVLDGLVFPFGDRQYGHLVCLTQVEGSGTDQVAHVFDEQHAAIFRLEAVQGMTDHVGIQVTALARVDLQGADAGLTDPVGIVGCLLITFDHGQAEFVFQCFDAAHQQGHLA